MELIETQVRPFVMDDAAQLKLEGEDVQLPPDHALGLGLIMHELASNAERFGALSTPKGLISISWTVEPAPRRLELHWTERNGPPVVEGAKPGFGGKLIQRGLEKVLESKVDFRLPKEGAEASISLPLD